ncbi:unnamed protein product [Urochloa humidicola]
MQIRSSLSLTHTYKLHGLGDGVCASGSSDESDDGKSPLRHPRRWPLGYDICAAMGLPPSRFCPPHRDLASR